MKKEDIKEITEELVNEIFNRKSEDEHKTSISNCEFNAVKFDESALEALEVISRAILENTKNIGKMLNVFNGSDIKMTLLSIGENERVVVSDSEFKGNGNTTRKW